MRIRNAAIILAVALVSSCALIEREPARVDVARVGETWTLANGALEFALEPDGTFDFLQRKTGQRWTAAAPEDSSVRVLSAEEGRREGTLDVRLEIDGAEYSMRATLGPGESALEIEITSLPNANSPLESRLNYPFAVAAPNETYNIVVPHKTGLMFTTQDAHMAERVMGDYEVYHGGGLSMPWFGMTNLAGGMMLKFETPDDCGVNVRLSDAGAYAAQPYWLPSMGQFRYARKLQYRFFDTGGYVEMCKAHREDLIARGQFVTLREKAASHPQLEKMIGAVNLHYWRGSEEDHRAIVDFFEQHGVKKMVVNNESSAEFQAWVSAKGYLSDVYTIFLQGRPRTDRFPIEPELFVPVENGNYLDAAGERPRSAGLCHLMQLPLLSQLVPAFINNRGYEGLFFDMTTASPLRECYNPAHMLDRRGDKQAKKALLRWSADLGILVGSEDGNDWACPDLHYFEGIAMPRRFGYGPDSGRVSQWPRVFEMTDDYKNIDLGARIRVPLFNLVFHDSVVSTWRWDFTPDRYGDWKWWDVHDLLHIISGDMPIFLINREVLPTTGVRVVQTYDSVCEWNQKVGWDELVDHKALTEDRRVQESRFSSGWAVTVNFSEDTAYVFKDGSSIDPLSYRTHRWK